MYDFNEESLTQRVEEFADNYNAEVDRFKRSFKGGSIDDFVRYEKIAWDRDLKADLRRGRHVEFSHANVKPATYRPFCRQFLYFDRILNAEVYGWPYLFPTAKSCRENQVIACSDIAFRAPAFSTLIANGPVDLHLCATLDGHQCFPFYVYDEDGTNRRENITDWALKQFREHYKDKKIDKWAIFNYVYGLLHHPGYRQKYADNLKRELPRIPLAPSPGTPGEGRGEGSSGFWAFSKAGEKLAKLHLDYEKLKPWDLDFIETPGVPLSYAIEDKMRLSKDKLRLTVNPSLTLAGIPAEAFEYRLGNRSAVEWVIDQYQVSEDKRSGIKSDPNPEDDPEYIVRLVAQVIRVSLETVKIVTALPAEFEPK
jgi:predicted helicase